MRGCERCGEERDNVKPTLAELTHKYADDPRGRKYIDLCDECASLENIKRMRKELERFM